MIGHAVDGPRREKQWPWQWDAVCSCGGGIRCNSTAAGAKAVLRRGGCLQKAPGPPGRDEGFSLVETIIGLTVLLIVLAGCSVGVMSSLQAMTASRQRLQVTQALASQVSKDSSVAETTVWTSSGPQGMPSMSTVMVQGTPITFVLTGGWCEQQPDGMWTSYTGYSAPSPPPPPSPGEIVTYTMVLGAPVAWRNVVSATWDSGQHMTIGSMLSPPPSQAVLPPSSGSCPS